MNTSPVEFPKKSDKDLANGSPEIPHKKLIIVSLTIVGLLAGYMLHMLTTGSRWERVLTPVIPVEAIKLINALDNIFYRGVDGVLYQCNLTEKQCNLVDQIPGSLEEGINNAVCDPKSEEFAWNTFPLQRLPPFWRSLAA